MSDDVSRRIGQYEIVRLIGRGSMGVLYQARDTVRHREVALKVMSADIAEDEEARARFRQEAQLAARQHRNIVKVFEFGEDGDTPFIAMEFLRGATLADRIASGEPLTLEAKLDVVTQVCDGLQCLHEEGIVHRDVKPSNIWLLEDGGVKLLDLGVAKHGSLKLTQYGNVVGSVAYIAPEQLSGTHVDGRADIFSAGVVLYELLSGRRPFHADSITAVMMKVLHEPAPDIRELAPDLPDDVVRAVTTALQKNPDDRYSEAAEFAADLRLARALSEATLAGSRSTVSRLGADVTLDSTVLSPRSAVPAPPVEHDPVLRSHGSVAVPSEASRSMAESKSTVLWIGAALAVVAIGGVGIWLLQRPARPNVFELEVKSVPDGAEISIDGATTGKRTPAVIELESRPDRIGLSLDGYEEFNAPLAAVAGPRANVQYTLRRLFEVHSDPPGARIILDGRDIGLVTPSALAMGDTPAAALELRLEGHEPARAGITPELLLAGTLRLTLSPVRGRGVAPPPDTKGGGTLTTPPKPVSTEVDVSISGQYPFEVSGCGTMSRAADRHTLKVTSPCKLRLLAPQYFLDEVREVDAPGGGRMDLAAPPLAVVQLRTRHLDCTLHMEGRSLGSPPVDVEMAVGTHSVTVVCKDQTMKSLPFPVEAGKTVRRIDEYLR